MGRISEMLKTEKGTLACSRWYEVSGVMSEGGLTGGDRVGVTPGWDGGVDWVLVEVSGRYGRL